MLVQYRCWCPNQVKQRQNDKTNSIGDENLSFKERGKKTCWDDLRQKNKNVPGKGRINYFGKTILFSIPGNGTHGLWSTAKSTRFRLFIVTSSNLDKKMLCSFFIIMVKFLFCLDCTFTCLPQRQRSRFSTVHPRFKSPGCYSCFCVRSKIEPVHGTALDLRLKHFYYDMRHLRITSVQSLLRIKI